MKARFPESKNLPGKMTDPISDMIIRIKNAKEAGKNSLDVPFSKLKQSICETLANKGFIVSAAKKGRKNKVLEIVIFQEGGSPKIKGVRRISKPSRRIYKKASELRPVKNGYGMLILSTPKGILAGDEAKKEKVGGEALFEIW